MPIAVIILAAGLGTRMKSTKPKVLHKLAGKSLLARVLLTAFELKQTDCAIVHGLNQYDLLKSQIEQEVTSTEHNLHWVLQSEQLGTGHATKIAADSLAKIKNHHEISQVLILYGDVPLIDIKDLENLINNTKINEIGLLTLRSTNPYGLGRIIRNDSNEITNIIEEKDADAQQKLISEVNTGIFLLPYPKVIAWLNDLTPNNNQKEYYLTDIVKKAVGENIKISSVTVADQDRYRGVNNLYQLSQAERHYQFLYALKLQEEGVNIIDPNRIDIRGELKAQSCIIDINCVFEGLVKIGKNCIIEPNCILKNVELGDNVHVKANSILENSIVSNDCIIGPFARIRPETLLEANVNIGNFVEIKKSKISKGTKINHLSYIGDSIIGMNVNIGAGTITCNYDGTNKHQTIIGDNAFIGSNTSLVAPIIIGANSTIGAGSTINKDAPDNKLTIARGKQTTIDNWQRKKSSDDDGTR